MAENENPATSNALRDSIYVDDVIFGAANDHETETQYIEVQKIFDRASKSQMWGSNSVVMRQKFKEQSDTAKITTATKVLGISWNQETDRLSFPLKHDVVSSTNRKLTKREAVHLIAQIYDPLGFVLPYTVTGKVLLQTIGKSEADWTRSYMTTSAASDVHGTVRCHN